MLYNIRYVMLYNIFKLLFYITCYVIQHILYMRYVMLYNICYAMLYNIYDITYVI